MIIKMMDGSTFSTEDNAAVLPDEPATVRFNPSEVSYHSAGPLESGDRNFPPTVNEQIKHATHDTADSTTRDVEAWAATLNVEKLVAYGLLRGLVAIGKASESPAPRVDGQRGKNKILYTVSRDAALFILNR